MHSFGGWRNSRGFINSFCHEHIYASILVQLPAKKKMMIPVWEAFHFIVNRDVFIRNKRSAHHKCINSKWRYRSVTEMNSPSHTIFLAQKLKSDQSDDLEYVSQHLILNAPLERWFDINRKYLKVMSTLSKSMWDYYIGQNFGAWKLQKFVS